MSLPLSVADFFFSCLFLSFTSSHSVCFRQRGFCGLFGCLLFLPHARLVSVSRLGFDFAFGLLSSLCWCWRGRLALASLCHHPLPKHAVLVSLACSCSSCSTSWCKWDLFPFLSVFFFFGISERTNSRDESGGEGFLCLGRTTTCFRQGSLESVKNHPRARRGQQEKRDCANFCVFVCACVIECVCACACVCVHALSLSGSSVQVCAVTYL